MDRIKVSVKGISPLVFSAPTKDKTPRTPEQEKQVALNKVRRTDAGELFITNDMIKGWLKCGVSMSKIKIEKSNKRALDLIDAIVFVEPEIIVVGNGKPLTMDDVFIDEYPMVVQGGPMRWNRSAYVKEWEAVFEIIFHPTISKGFIEEGIASASLLCGVGGRRNRGFGKVEVLS